MLEELDWLEADRNAGYLPRPIPDPLDEEIRELVDPVLDSGSWSALRARITPAHHAVLRVFAERMASLAVRRRDPELLEIALVALALGGLDSGSREALAIVPLVYRSAERLEVDPQELFEDVARYVGDEAAAQLRAFPQRSPRNRSIGAMGYEEARDEGGFRYRRTW